MSEVKKVKYKYVPVNGSCLVEVLNHKEWLTDVLGVNPDEEKKTESGLLLNTTLGDDVSMMVQYAKGKVVQLSTPPDNGLQLGDYVIYNTEAVLERTALNDPKLSSVKYHDVISIVRIEN